MGYTPDNQKIEGPLAEALQAIRRLRKVIDARLCDAGEWTDEHRCKLKRAEIALINVDRQLTEDLSRRL